MKEINKKVCYTFELDNQEIKGCVTQRKIFLLLTEQADE